MVEQLSTRQEAISTHPALDVIRERLLGDMQIRLLTGNSITPLEQMGIDAMHIPSSSARSEQVLSYENPKDAEALRTVLRNGFRLYLFLAEIEKNEYLEEPTFLLTRDIKTQYFDFFVSNPDFDLNYTLYYDSLFELRIDYTKMVSLGRKPRYRSGIASLKNDMTKEEAEITNFYMGQFLQRHPVKILSLTRQGA